MIATDTDGNVLLAGTLQGSVMFGGETIAPVNAHDIFVAKLSP